MGDIWPYEPPKYVTWQNTRSQFESEGISANNAAVFAAIGTAESSLDLSVINDTPATGDYSVGCFQINYYGSLYAGRAGEFGTPRQLILNGLTAQVKAAISIWHQQGFHAWSTYSSGAYIQYLHGAPTPAGGPGGVPGLPVHDISPPLEDYSATVRAGAGAFTAAGNSLNAGAAAIAALLK
jgi:hypothetical protein